MKRIIAYFGVTLFLYNSAQAMLGRTSSRRLTTFEQRMGETSATEYTPQVMRHPHLQHHRFMTEQQAPRTLFSKETTPQTIQQRAAVARWQQEAPHSIWQQPSRSTSSFGMTQPFAQPYQTIQKRIFSVGTQEDPWANLRGNIASKFAEWGKQARNSGGNLTIELKGVLDHLYKYQRVPSVALGVPKNPSPSAVKSAAYTYLKEYNIENYPKNPTEVNEIARLVNNFSERLLKGEADPISLYPTMIEVYKGPDTMPRHESLILYYKSDLEEFIRYLKQNRKDLPAALGVDQGATYQEAHAAYSALRNAFRPEKYMPFSKNCYLASEVCGLLEQYITEWEEHQKARKSTTLATGKSSRSIPIRKVPLERVVPSRSYEDLKNDNPQDMLNHVNSTKNPYLILGVNPSADARMVNTAYKTLMKTFYFDDTIAKKLNNARDEIFEEFELQAQEAKLD